MKIGTVLVCAATLAAVCAFPAEAPAQSGPGATACFPGCRSGYVCVQNQCVSACNPPCADGQSCTAAGECIAAPPPPAATQAAAPPVPKPAAPDPAATSSKASSGGIHTHDGLYLRAALGASFTASGSATLPGSSQDISISGSGVGLELAVGETWQHGIVLGGGIYGQSVGSPSYSMSGVSTTGGKLSATGIGPFVDWYPDPAGGLHAEAALGLAVISASKGDQFPVKDNNGNGFSLLAGVGYEWWFGEQVSLGVLARLQYAQADVKGDGDTQSVTVKLVTPAVLASLTYQ